MADEILLAKHFYDQARYRDVERYCRELLAREPEEINALHLLALSLAEQGRLPEAESVSQACMAASPEQALGYYTHAFVLSRWDRTREAEPFAARATELEPESAANWDIAARVAFDLGEFEKALERTARGLEMDPTHPRCLDVHASALFALGRVQEAEAKMAEGLRHHPEDAYLLEQVGWFRLLRGKPRQAEACFLDCLRIEPNHLGGRRGLLGALRAQNLLLAPLCWLCAWSARLMSFERALFLFGLLLASTLVTTRLTEATMLVLLVLWLTRPLGNLLLQLHPLARKVLWKLERVESWVVLALGPVMWLLVRHGEFALAKSFLGALFVYLASQGDYRIQGPARRAGLRKLALAVLLIAVALRLLGLPGVSFGYWVGLFFALLGCSAVFLI